MKKLVLILSLLLVGCSHDDTHVVPGVKPVEIPALPANLSVKAKKLPPITDNTMGGREVVGATSDQAYNSIAHQLNKTIDLYNCVRDSINNKKNAEGCLK